MHCPLRMALASGRLPLVDGMGRERDSDREMIGGGDWNRSA